MKDKTLIIGASNNTNRYSYKAAFSLQHSGFKFIPFGVKRGDVIGRTIQNEWNPDWKDEVDTVTMYINPKLQEQYYQAIIDLAPRRVIFNPGTENYDFAQQLAAADIDSENACTLVLLGSNQY
jgi:predicted CoA-binding protein